MESVLDYLTPHLKTMVTVFVFGMAFFIMVSVYKVFEEYRLARKERMEADLYATHTFVELVKAARGGDHKAASVETAEQLAAIMGVYQMARKHAILREMGIAALKSLRPITIDHQGWNRVPVDQYIHKLESKWL